GSGRGPALVVHNKRGGFMARKIFRRDYTARGVDEPHVQRDDVASLEERLFARGNRVSVLPGARERRLPWPDPDVHAERLAVPRDRGADPAVAIDAERLAAQRVAH